uniref:Uncharacterized protein n=1 Tax=Acrobeloides nanus TaxID=290746 RepID=A0A914DEK6_9BILA
MMNNNEINDKVNLWLNNNHEVTNQPDRSTDVTDLIDLFDAVAISTPEDLILDLDDAFSIRMKVLNA